MEAISLVRMPITPPRPQNQGVAQQIEADAPQPPLQHPQAHPRHAPTRINQGTPYVALQIEPDAPQPPLPPQPRHAPAWINQIRQNLRQHAPEIILPLTTGAAAMATSIGAYYRSKRVDIDTDLGFVTLTSVSAALSIMTMYFAHEAIRALSSRSLADVVNDFQTQRAGSSSASAPDFDWSKPGLFLNEKGQDVGPDVSIYLNRLLDVLKNEPGQNSSENYNNINGYLDLLATSHEARSGLAKQIQELNSACLNRNAASINTILREIRKNYADDMPIEDFMRLAVLEMALKKADAELMTIMKKKEMTAISEGYQAVQGDVVKKLREKFPVLPHQFEHVYQGYGDVSGLTRDERAELSEEIVKEITDPVKCARLLQDSPKENAFMEKRFADAFNEINAPLSDENRKKRYAEAAMEAGKAELSLEEMVPIDVALKTERDEAVQRFYAKIIKDSTGLGNSAG